MRIALVGGGSGGPVSPLLAVAEEIKNIHPKTHFFLIGTKNGPEQIMAKEAGVEFFAIPAGKLRRYFSIRNLFSPFLTIAGFFKAINILKQQKPDCVFGTGSFVQVPVMWAAWFLKIPVVLHQQDLVVSLANSICQFTAKKITVTFEDSVSHFVSSIGFFYKKSPDKVLLTGNPFRSELKHEDKEKSLKAFGLKSDLPVLLVLGGGTGSAFLNDLVYKALPKLSKTIQIIHSTGKNKNKYSEQENYHPKEFISNMGQAYAASDIVLCRAGLSTITELSNLKKVSIIVPMPKSHQEINALLLAQQSASLVATQEMLSADVLVRVIRKVLFDRQIQEDLRKNISNIMPKNAGKKIAEIICKVAQNE